jgi:hypothetical protein
MHPLPSLSIPKCILEKSSRLPSSDLRHHQASCPDLTRSVALADCGRRTAAYAGPCSFCLRRMLTPYGLVEICSCRRFTLLRRPLLVIFQRRNFHQGPFRVGAMHGLAVVSQCLLRKAFRHSARLGPFRPSVAVAVQRHADNAKLAATRGKFHGAVASTHTGQVRKQRASP